MTIHFSPAIGSYVEIVPIQANFLDTEKSNILTAKIISDNLTDAATFGYNLINFSNDTPITMYSGTLNIFGDAYKNWSGDSDYVYEFICKTLGLTIIN